MEIKRFFADAADFDGNRILIYGDEFIHLTKVLRHKVGYKIIVNLDDGNDYNCVLSEIRSDCAVAQVEEVLPNECNACASVTLFQALPKGDKIDLIVQKCVELGAEEITPFLSAYTNETKFNAVRENRIAAEACKQCGRSRRAKVGDLLTFDAMIERLKEFDTVVMPYEHATGGRMSEVSGLGEGRKIALIIGSEGGFCKEEVDRVIAVGGQVISLGKRILRCETASIVALSLIMYEMDELQN